MNKFTQDTLDLPLKFKIYDYLCANLGQWFLVKEIGEHCRANYAKGISDGSIRYNLSHLLADKKIEQVRAVVTKRAKGNNRYQYRVTVPDVEYARNIAYLKDLVMFSTFIDFADVPPRSAFMDFIDGVEHEPFGAAE